MPDQGMWEGFFSPATVLETLGLDKGVQDAVEFGCGYGTFTIPAAWMINGLIYALDIEPDMISVTENEAKKAIVALNARLAIQSIVRPKGAW